MKKREDRPIRRAPMKINEAGEVVFCESPGDTTDTRKRDINRKPTALMLCNEISRMFGNAMRENTEAQNLHGSHRDILFHLSHKDGRTQLEIANLIHLKPPTVSVALGKLEDEGYVTRKCDPMDARCTRVYLTDKGKSIHEKAHEVIRTLEQEAVKGFSEDELKQLNLLLFKLRENIADDN